MDVEKVYWVAPGHWWERDWGIYIWESRKRAKGRLVRALIYRHMSLVKKK